MIKHTALSICWCLLLFQPPLRAQTRSLTLRETCSLATANYPLVKQYNLIAESAKYAAEQAHTGYLPQINVNGQATYQSAVTQLPIQLPGADVPSLSNDQYKLFGEVNQSLYDGGRIKLQKAAIEAAAEVEQQAVNVAQYQIKERVTQLFFGVLLLDAQLAQIGLLINDIQAGMAKTGAAIANGTALKSSGSLLEAELLKAEQHNIALQTTRTAYLHMLGLFINQQLDEDTVLERPEAAPSTAAINRPELGWYAQQQSSIDVDRKLLTAKNRPRLGLFMQGGLGRPALNMLSNDFEAYYYGGIRLAIPLSGFYTLKKEKATLDIRKKIIDVQKDVFLFNTDLAMKQQNTEIAKYAKLLARDDKIIALRSSVKAAALAQLENGIINTADYLREVNAEDNARLTKIQHEIELLKAQYNLQYTAGNL